MWDRSIKHRTDEFTYARVLIEQEKGSDVNLAPFLVDDCITGVCDKAIVVSNESDLAGAIAIAKKYAIAIGIVNPHKCLTSRHLTRVASFETFLRKETLLRSQFPQSLVDSKGRIISRPKSWASTQKPAPRTLPTKQKSRVQIFYQRPDTRLQPVFGENIDVEYSHNQYGDVFADVYDEWYDNLDPVHEVVNFVAQLATTTSVLELGVGTGRLAIPLAVRGIPVVGIDSSAAMLDVLRKKPYGDQVETYLGHMVSEMPSGPFGVVLIAYNTLFNLLFEHEQRECLVQSARRLAPGGHVIVDCFVPNDSLPDHVAPYPVRTSRSAVVTSEATVDQDAQLMHGSFNEVDGIGTHRPWSVRFATIAQIDDMATHANLVLEQRWSTYSCEAFTSESQRHISVYGMASQHLA
jgi:SAM-dependent methyltransferase